MAEETCTVCGEERHGRGAGGLCNRCYVKKWRGGTPTVERAHRAPGDSTRLQLRVDRDLAERMAQAAERLGRPPGQWLEDAIREKLDREQAAQSPPPRGAE